MTALRSCVLSLAVVAAMRALVFADVAPPRQEPNKCSVAHVGTTTAEAGLSLAWVGIALLARRRRRG